MMIRIGGGLVPLVRDGLYFDLNGHFERASALIEHRRGQSIREALCGCLARATASQALFEVLGWDDAAAGGATVDVDVDLHGFALARAIRVRLESERGVTGDRRAGEREKALAAERAQALEALLACTEGPPGWRVVEVPGRLVDLLREVLVEQIASCAEEIRDDGHSHPDVGLDEGLLAAFDVCRMVLEHVGFVPVAPTADIELDVFDAQRELLVEALEKRLDFEQYMMDVDRGLPDGEKQYQGALRRRGEARELLALINPAESASGSEGPAQGASCSGEDGDQHG